MKSKVTCSTGFLLVTAVLIYLDGQGLILQYFIACILHEAGHWSAVRILGGRVQALRLSAIGAEMLLDPRQPLSYGREMITALSGPAVNLFLAWISGLCGFYLFAGINLSLGVLNLLPIRPLDGGRALSCALSFRWPGGAEPVVGIVSAACAGCLLGLGWFAWQKWGNLTLFCAALWLMLGILK